MSASRKNFELTAMRSLSPVVSASISSFACPKSGALPRSTNGLSGAMSRTTILLKSRTMTSTRSSAEMSSPRSVSTSSVLCFGSIFS